MEKEKYCVEKLEPLKELPVFSLFSTKGAGEETIEKPDGKRDIHSFDALRILVLKKFFFYFKRHFSNFLPDSGRAAAAVLAVPILRRWIPRNSVR